MKIRVAIAGLGFWGPNLLRTFLECPEAEVTVCIDQDVQRLQLAKQLVPEALLLASFDNLPWDEVDAVVLATPAVTHGTLGMRVLNQGKHLFVEKPLALKEIEAAWLVDYARDKGLVVMVDHLLLYHPAVKQLKGSIDAGILGQLRHLHSDRLNLGIVRRDEDVLWSLAPHDVAVAVHLVGHTPDTVSAVGGSFLFPDKPDVVTGSMSFPGGVLCTFRVSWMDPVKVRRLSVVGSGGMAVFDDVEQEEKLRLYSRWIDSNFQPHPGEAISPMQSEEKPLWCAAQDFLDTIKTGKLPLANGQHGLEVVKTLVALSESLRRGGEPVQVGRGENVRSAV